MSNTFPRRPTFRPRTSDRLAARPSLHYAAWNLPGARSQEDGAMRTDRVSQHRKPLVWARRHLLGLEELSREELLTILDTAEGFVEASTTPSKRRDDLKGNVVVSLFFEPSTRTKSSFAFAAKR